MSDYRLWDTERTESTPVADVQLADDGMVYILALTLNVDAAEDERRQRILRQDYALLELQDRSTTLVELMDDAQAPTAAFPPSYKTVRYLIVG